MECALCGREVKALNKAEVEGSIVEVCDSCLKFGKRIEPVAYKPIKRTIKLGESEFELVPRYGELIKKSRENKGLERIDFAKELNEKESVIKRIEEQRMEPDEKLVKKIESFLGIKLTEKYEE